MPQRIINDEPIRHRDAVATTATGNEQSSLEIRYTILATDGNAQPLSNLTEQQIYNTPNLPAKYDPIRGLKVRRRTLDFKDAAAGLYYVDCQLDAEVSEIPQLQQEQPPQLRTPEWSWSTETIEEVQRYDAEDHNTLIQTKAYDPIIVTRPRPIPVLTISRLQLKFDAAVFGAYQFHSNRTPFWGAPPRCAVLWDITDREEIIQWQKTTLALRRVTYVVKFNNQKDKGGGLLGWRHYLLHEGEHYLADGSQVKFKDYDQRPRIGLLKDDGTPAPSGYPPGYLTFAMFPTVDLNQLQLGPY